MKTFTIEQLQSQLSTLNKQAYYKLHLKIMEILKLNDNMIDISHMKQFEIDYLIDYIYNVENKDAKIIENKLVILD